MKKSLFVITAALLSLTGLMDGLPLRRAIASTGEEKSALPPPDFSPPDPSDLPNNLDGFIIKFKEPRIGVDKSAYPQSLVAQLSALAGAPLVYELELSGGAHLIKTTSEHANEETWLKLARNADALGIESISPNAMRQVAITPNDPQFGQQLYYQEVSPSNYSANLTGAWDITTGSSDIVVAVVDTGIRPDHPDLAGRLLDGYDFVTNTYISNDGDARDANPTDPGDWVDDLDRATSGSPLRSCTRRDSIWHGTHIAGIIGAAGNNGTGIAGVNWGSKILPVRVMGKCGGYDADIVDGIRWAAGLFVPGVPRNKFPARVINLSLGGWGLCSAAYQTAINDAVNAGAIVVVAAGNTSADAKDFTPANCQNVITVGATARTGNRATYSNYGPLVTISAPGGDSRTSASDSVLSTVDLGKTVPITPGYKGYDGTSMAAAEVSGIVSLMASTRPALTGEEVRFILRSSATAFPTSSTCNTSLCGSGVINAAAAVQMALSARFSKMYLPKVVNTLGAPPPVEVAVLNGDFEQGNNVGWGSRSSLSLGNLILSTDSLPTSISPHGGKWLAWLGGVNAETSTIETSLTIPAEAPLLSFWHRVKSIETDCSKDIAVFKINGNDVDTVGLCAGTSTLGWLSRSLNLSDYAGQTVTLTLQVTTDDAAASSLFVDDWVFKAE
jgi:serine protease